MALWDTSEDRQLAMHRLPAAEPPGAELTGAELSHRRRPLRYREGCVVATSAGLYWLQDSGAPVRLLSEAIDAVAGDGDSLWVARDGELVQLSGVGGGAGKVATDTVARLDGHASALVVRHGVRLVGYRDGRVERNGVTAQRPLQARPTSPVTALLLGPLDTVMVGFADGHAGVWHLTSGERLFAVRLHGRVTHLALDGDRFRADTDLGASYTWDAAVLRISRCVLLRQVWREAPTIWQAGGPVLSAPVPEHACLREATP